jgi:hypothetical protein
MPPDHFPLRLLGRFTTYAGVALDKQESDLVRNSDRNIFGDPIMA